MHLVLLSITGGILFAFGWLVAVHLLRLRDGISCLGMTMLCGPMTYLIMLNSLLYLIPIRAAAHLSLLLLVVTSIFVFLSTTEEVHSLEWPPRMLVISMVIAIFLTTLMQLRLGPSDALSWTQMPMVSTIAEGNFPVVQPHNPWHMARYHYGAELLAAAATVVTGASINLAYAVQSFFAVAGFLFTAMGLAYRMTRNWYAAFWASFLAFFGTGLLWLHGSSLVSDLYSTLVLGHDIHGPFRRLFQMRWSPVTNSLFVIFQHRSSMIGFPALFGLLYVLHGIFHEQLHDRAPWAVLSIVFAAALALSMEIGLLVLCVAIVPWVLCLACNAHQDARRVALFSAMIVPLSLAISMIQGGMLTRWGPGSSVGSVSLAFNTTLVPWNSAVVPLWSWFFIRDFGFPLILLPVLIWYAWYQRRQTPYIGLLLFIGMVYFSVPIFTHFSPRSHETLRFFWGATSMFSFLIGISAWQWAHQSLVRKKVFMMYALFCSTSLSSLVALMLLLPFPTARFERRSFLPPMPPVSDAELRAYSWIRDQTDIHDYFYSFTGDSFDQTAFIVHSGRFSVGPRYGDSFEAQRASALDEFENTCNPGTFRAIGIAYLAIMKLNDLHGFNRTAMYRSGILCIEKLRH